MNSKYTIAGKAIFATAVLLASVVCANAAFGFQGTLTGGGTADITLESKINMQTLEFAGLSEDIEGWPSDRFTTSNSSAEPTTNLGTDFGTLLTYIQSKEVEFQVRHADRTTPVVVTGVFIGRRIDPFSFQREQIPASHTSSFNARISDGNRITVKFSPKAIGLIETDLMIDYSIGGSRFRARAQLNGRGYLYWPQFSYETVSMYGDTLFGHFTGSGDRDSKSGTGPNFMTLTFERPITGATVYIFPKRGSPKLNANLFDARTFKDGVQFRDFGNYYVANVAYTGGIKSRLGVKVAIGTSVESARTDYDIYVVATPFRP